MNAANRVTAPDENGNLNNILSVEPQNSKVAAEIPVEIIPAPAAHDLNTKEAPIVEDEPKLNGVAEQEELAKSQPPTDEVVPELDDSEAPKASQTAIGLSG